MRFQFHLPDHNQVAARLKQDLFKIGKFEQICISLHCYFVIQLLIGQKIQENIISIMKRVPAEMSSASVNI